MPDAGRVITGSAKGIRLAAAGPATRPLGDRVKQALFGSLEAELGDAWPGPFLDLFAGSGAAGIEALSRGAPLALFVERDQGAARTIEENLRRTRVEGGRLLRRDALAVLREGGSRVGGPFVAAVVDPPYAEPATLAASLELLGDQTLDWLAPEIVVIAKHFWRDEPPKEAGSLSAERQRRFGDTSLTYYRQR